MTIGRFWPAVSLTWRPRGGGTHESASTSSCPPPAPPAVPRPSPPPLPPMPLGSLRPSFSSSAAAAQLAALLFLIVLRRRCSAHSSPTAGSASAPIPLCHGHHCGRSSSSAPAIPGLPPRFRAGIGFASVSPPFSLGSRPPPMPLPTLSTRAATHRPRAIDLAVDDHLRPPLLPPRHTHRARHLPVQPVRPTGGGGG